MEKTAAAESKALGVLATGEGLVKIKIGETEEGGALLVEGQEAVKAGQELDALAKRTAAVGQAEGAIASTAPDQGLLSSAQAEGVFDSLKEKTGMNREKLESAALGAGGDLGKLKTLVSGAVPGEAFDNAVNLGKELSSESRKETFAKSTAGTLRKQLKDKLKGKEAEQARPGTASLSPKSKATAVGTQVLPEPGPKTEAPADKKFEDSEFSQGLRPSSDLFGASNADMNTYNTPLFERVTLKYRSRWETLPRKGK